MDFGSDALFLFEGIALAPVRRGEVEPMYESSVDLVNQGEKTSGATARMLWSESGETLPEIDSRLQKVQ